MSVDWNNLLATWYMWLGSLNAALAQPIRALSDGLGVPFVSAFLLGVLGTTAPCQLSTNFAALAFLARQPSERGATFRATLAYIAAKTVVYTLLGLVVLTLGRQLFNAAGLYLDWARKIIGPVMVLLGLAVLGVIHSRLQAGQRFAKELQIRAAAIDAGEHGTLSLPQPSSGISLMPLVAAVGAEAGAGRGATTG
ncbi:MAG: sulfite exporter TauE/SafE family protein, partial [Chloroflexota bacterium]|nr:sulfite exporter TauE/SafE family protein [Chloroflexota bacterium]